MCVHLFTAFTLSSGNSDSLVKILGELSHEDSLKCSTLYKTGLSYFEEGNYSSAILHLDQSSRLAKKLHLKDLFALSENVLGDCYSGMDELEKAKAHYEQSLSIFKSINSKHGIAVTLNDLGNLEETGGNYNQALKHFFEYLKYAEDVKSKKDIAIAYNNIAIIYSDIGDYKKELAYNFKALKIREQESDQLQLAASYNNVGVSYQNLVNYNLAIPYYKKALELRQKLNDESGIAACYHNLAICYKVLQDFNRAEEYYLKALEIQERLNAKADITLTSINLGRFYFERKNYGKAFSYLNNALKLSEESDLISYKMDAHEALYDVYIWVNNDSKALIHYRNFISIRDSLNNIDQSKEFTRIEMQNKFEKELSARQLEQAKKDAIQLQHQKQQRFIIITACILLAIISLFLVFVYRSYRQKQQANVIITRQKKEVEEQKHLVEEKQKEIIDSINYAKRIQSAILAREEDIQSVYPESFLFYKPKDIVAGDFYFFEVGNGHVFYAAADCTGHGVPGALVSVVCSNALTRCVKEFNLTDPGLILDKTRELVLDTFKKSGQDVKDGMDISLLVKNSSNNTYTWAGANNPLWYISNGTVSEITATKQPIGMVDNPSPFTSHLVPVIKNDKIYLFTDGYADQFGGPKGKKFKYKQLSDLLSSAQKQDMKSQKEILVSRFSEWMGSQDQVDDVLIIGITV